MVDIIKASGEREPFSPNKLRRSLKRAGASPDSIEKVVAEITRELKDGMKTSRIYRQAFGLLRKFERPAAGRYSLKKAIMELGPTGFPFEKYIAEILKEYGYTTEVGRQIKGACVTHEVDVIAHKGKKHFMIECKYHNSRGIRSDVKVALYTYARFLDLKKQWENLPGHQNFFYQGWLVTNTKCTSQAIRYARCVGLKIMSWRYPKKESLEYLIEKKGLYPITILPLLPRYAKERLAQKRIMLAKDLLKYSTNDLVRIVGLRSNIVRKLQEETKELYRH